jgi:biotin carboxyl carrier protein
MQSKVGSGVAGKVWKIEVALGQAVAAEDTLVIIESMKMEIPVDAPRAGTVAEIRVAEGDSVAEGQIVVILD